MPFAAQIPVRRCGYASFRALVSRCRIEAATAVFFAAPGQDDVADGDMVIESSDLTGFASDASFSIDGHHAIVGWNESARLLLGYEPDEAVGKQCSDILQFVYFDGEPLCSDACECWQCFEHDLPFGAPFCRARHKNGEWVPLSISSVVLPKNGEPRPIDSTVAIIFVREETQTREGPPVEEKLQIRSLGNFSLTIGGKAIPIGDWQRKQSVSLLKYLAAQLGQPVHRGVLIRPQLGAFVERCWSISCGISCKPPVCKETSWKRSAKIICSTTRRSGWIPWRSKTLLQRAPGCKVNNGGPRR